MNLRMPTSGIKLAFRAAAATGLSLALAQRLCLTFDERFVGIEVEGRYIRICDDDTA